MGIKGLWTVFTPFSEKKSLHELRGETIAVDLSGWVCDSQNVTDYYVQPKLYLRNLFFRTAYLLLADIKPVFVLEGDAPELKRDVMAARNAIQFRGAAPRSETATTKRPDVGRKRFRGVQKECESLLRSMGVSCIKGQGEAEATCAQLNAQGMVDAVVSQDSDCFAYGARRVYRNFSVSNSAGGGALQGSVDCYDADKMMQQNGFGRNKMVALALLCGCDYGVGACGSSIVTAVAFLHSVSDKDIIPRLLSWVTDPEHYDRKARWCNVPGRCERCGHGGRTHAKNGCPTCVTDRGCTDTGHKSKVAELKKELALRSRALSCGAPFPEPRVMKEFLNIPPEELDLDKLTPTMPSMIQFIKLMSKKLDWSERYCVEKFLPLLTKFHLQDRVPHRTIRPAVINKKRTPRGVPSYEVVWADIDGEYEGLIPDDQFEDDEDHLKPWTTIERQDLMRKYYPPLVEAYEESVKKPAKEKKPKAGKKKEENETKPKRKYNRKKKVTEDVIANLSNSIKLCNISGKETERDVSKANVSVSVKRLKRKLKNSKTKGQKTIDSFLPNKKRKSTTKLIESLRRSFKNISVVNDDEFNEIFARQLDADKENTDKGIDKSMNLLDSSDEDINESDLSAIVDQMVAKAPQSKTATVNNNLVKLVFSKKFTTPKKTAPRPSILGEIQKKYCSTPKGSPARKSFLRDGNISNNSVISKVNTSFFFDKLTEECDAFEMSVNYKSAIVLDSDVENTVSYSLGHVSLE